MPTCAPTCACLRACCQRETRGADEGGERVGARRDGRRGCRLGPLPGAGASWCFLRASRPPSLSMSRQLPPRPGPAPSLPPASTSEASRAQGRPLSSWEGGETAGARAGSADPGSAGTGWMLCSGPASRGQPRGPGGSAQGSRKSWVWAARGPEEPPPQKAPVRPSRSLSPPGGGGGAPRAAELPPDAGCRAGSLRGLGRGPQAQGQGQGESGGRFSGLRASPGEGDRRRSLGNPRPKPRCGQEPGFPPDHRRQPRGPRAGSHPPPGRIHPAPSFDLAIAKEQSRLLSPKTTFGPWEAAAGLMWPPVNLSLTPLHLELRKGDQGSHSHWQVFGRWGPRLGAGPGAGAGAGHEPAAPPRAPQLPRPAGMTGPQAQGVPGREDECLRSPGSGCSRARPGVEKLPLQPGSERPQAPQRPELLPGLARALSLVPPHTGSLSHPQGWPAGKCP